MWAIIQQFLEQGIADIKPSQKGLIGYIVHTIVSVNMKETAFLLLCFVFGFVCLFVLVFCLVEGRGDVDTV